MLFARDLTTFRIGGPLEEVADPATPDEAAAVVRRCAATGRPWRVLGRGSNLLVDDGGVDGVVIRTARLTGLRFEETDTPDTMRVVAGAGVNTSVLLSETTRRGLGGLSCLVGYPATVGGAVRMNAGGKWGETGARVESVRAVDADGVLRALSREDCGFAYRRSVFGPMLVVEATFLLPRTDVRAYRAEIASIHREKSAIQPLSAASAGCMFRNPPGDSAGRLIDACGMKGRTHGGAVVSPRHGNFFENRGGATCGDVLRLADTVRDAVFRRAGVELRMEVLVWRRGHVPGGE